MRIRQVFFLAIALGSAVGGVAAVMFALQQASALHQAWAVKHDTRLLTSALRLTEMMNMERAFINARLVAPPPTAEQMAPAHRQADLADASLSQTLQLARDAADRDALAAVESRLLRIRRTALAAIDWRADARTATLVDTYLADMFAIQDAAYAMAISIQRRTLADPAVGQATRLALLAWEMRDWSGRQTTTLISNIGERVPMAGEQAETLAEYKGRIEAKWASARVVALQMNRPDVAAAVTTVERGFWTRGGEAYATYVVPNRGRPVALGIDRFVTDIRLVLDTILPLRDTALRAALQDSDRTITDLRLRLLLAIGLVVLTGGTTLAVSLWFDRRVVRPIGEITTTILFLAAGNRDQPVPLQGRSDELGEMASAAETLRRNAIAAEASAGELLALQHARAEEKSRLLAELTASHHELEALARDLESLAATDALTGIPNRRSFDLSLAREWRRAVRDEKPLGLLMLDVDRFKAFNDLYGHPAGDACLAHVAAAVMSSVCRPGDLAARYGGEEFAVLLPDTEENGTTHLAERIHRAVAGLAIAHAASEGGVITVSIGTAVMIPDWLECAETLVALADRALYSAKQAGRNRTASACDAPSQPGDSRNGRDQVFHLPATLTVSALK